MIAVIVLLRQFFKQYLPRTAFVILWLTAAIRMLCPFRLPSAASIWSLLKTLEGVPGGTAAVRRYRLAPAVHTPLHDTLPSAFALFKTVWLVGAALLALSILLLYLHSLRKARASTPLPNGAYVCKNIASPCLCGILRPRILLPEDVSETLLPYILLHEQMHMRRHDNLWNLLALAAAAIHWMNPAAWVLVVLLRRDLEISCDEWALRSLNQEQRRSYALSLIAMAESPCGRSPLVCGFAQNPLEERIRNIMKNRKKSAFALSVATAMILCTTSAFATDAPVVTAGSTETAYVKTGTYVITSDKRAEEVRLSVTDKTGVMITDTTDMVSGITDVEFFTAEEYAACLAEQKSILLREVESGSLSQEDYNQTIRNMEEILEGIKDNSFTVAKPFTDENGNEISIVISLPEDTETESSKTHYSIEAGDGSTAVINGKSYSVTAEKLSAK